MAEPRAYKTPGTSPKISPVTLKFAGCQVHFGKVVARSIPISVRVHDNSIYNILYFVRMTSDDIRSSVIVPKGACIIAFEVEVYSVTPTTLVPDILCSEDDLWLDCPSGTFLP
jgi:hypothetical protein